MLHAPRDGPAAASEGLMITPGRKISRETLRFVLMLTTSLPAAGCCFGASESTSTVTPPGTGDSTPGAAVGAGSSAPTAASPPAVTVASCTATSAAGTLCTEFDQAQYTRLGASGVGAICSSELSSTVRVNVPCSPFDRIGSCDMRDHVLYAYWGGSARESDHRSVCGTMGGRFMAGGALAEPGRDAVHPDANTPMMVDQAVLYLGDGATGTRLARVVDLLPDGRVTVQDQGDRATVTRDRVWVGSYTGVPDGLGNSDANDFPTITDAPLPAGTEVWARDTWWYRGVVVEDTGADTLRVDLYGFAGEPQAFRRRNVRLHR